MPASNVPLRTAPVTASEGIHDTLVTDDSIRMFSLPAIRLVGEYVATSARARGEAACQGGGLHHLVEVTSHLVGKPTTIWNGGPWGTAGSLCSSPTTKVGRA